MKKIDTKLFSFWIAILPNLYNYLHKIWGFKKTYLWYLVYDIWNKENDWNKKISWIFAPL